MKNIQILLTLLILLLLVIPLGAQPVFTISSSYNNLLSNPEGQGLLDLLLKEVFNRLDREVKIVYTETAPPSSRGIEKKEPRLRRDAALFLSWGKLRVFRRTLPFQ